jgi:hypothetical protein
MTSRQEDILLRYLCVITQLPTGAVPGAHTSRPSQNTVIGYASVFAFIYFTSHSRPWFALDFFDLRLHFPLGLFLGRFSLDLDLPSLHEG